MQAYRVVSDSSGFNCSAIVFVIASHSDGRGGSQRASETICIGDRATEIVGTVSNAIVEHVAPLLLNTAAGTKQIARSCMRSAETGPMVPAAVVSHGRDKQVIRGSTELSRPARILMRPGVCFPACGCIPVPTLLRI